MMTTDFKNEILTNYFKELDGGTFAGIYVALFDGTGTEIAYSGYARQAVTFGEVTTGTLSNASALSFPATATDLAEQITTAKIVTDVTGGTELYTYTLPAPISLAEGESVRISVGSLTLGFN